MYNYYPLLVIGGVLGALSTVFILAYVFMKDKKEAIGFDRHMKDSEILKRLLPYAKPYKWQFFTVFLLVLVSIVYDILSPLLIGKVTALIGESFEMRELLTMVFTYASILVVSMAASYFQALILQRTGQRIVSRVRRLDAGCILHRKRRAHRRGVQGNGGWLVCSRPYPRKV